MFSTRCIQFFTKDCPNYLEEVYVPTETNELHMRSSYQKSNALRRKANGGQKDFLMLVPDFETRR